MNKKKTYFKEIKDFINKNINPLLYNHGGYIKLLNIDEENNLFIKIYGKCKSCLFNKYTFENLIKKKILKFFPYIKKIINI